MPSKRPDDHFAFMSSSNDTLSPNGHANGSFHNGNLSPKSLLHNPYNETAILSSPGLASNMQSLSSVPSREQIPSASSLPAGGAFSPIDQERFYEDMYNKALEAHEYEKDMWKTERAHMLQERQHLRDEIARLKAESGRRSFSRQESGDKVYYDPSTVKNANEKLRQLSVVGGSGESTARMSREGSWNGDGTQTKVHQGSISDMDRLGSIQEDQPDIDGIHLKAPRMDSSTFEEDPRSPPTTARAQINSPLPSNYTMHAGHTPMGSLSRIPPENNPAMQDYWEDQTRQKVTTVPKDVFTPESRGEHAEPVLKEPHLLPTRPDLGDSTMLRELDVKLQDVQDYPKANRPEVLRDDITESDIQTEDNDVGARVADENDGDATNGDPPVRRSREDPINAAVKGTDENMGGVRLKLKQSMNFGSALGKLN